jgi:hypothetical protein
MKKVFLGLVVGLLAGGGSAWFFLRHHGGEAEAKKEEEKKEESHVQHDENDGTFLKLDKEFQWRADLKVTTLEAAELKPELKAFGRVLDPGPLAMALNTVAAARAQLEASNKEAARLKVLFGQNQNASARALEIAEAAVKRDQIAVQVAELALVTMWGKAITDRADLDSLVHSLVAQENAVVRVDLSASDKLDSAPAAARIALLAAPDAPIDAEFLGASVSADPQTLGRGFFFLVKGKALPANVAVIAWLSLSGEMQKGVVAPREAILRHEGRAFVYVQTTDETFQRFEIGLHHPLKAGWFVDELKPGVKVVISGAQQLLSEELKGEAASE